MYGVLKCEVLNVENVIFLGLNKILFEMFKMKVVIKDKWCVWSSCYFYFDWLFWFCNVGELCVE